MAKPYISTEVNLALNFFTALGRDDYEEAIFILKSAYLCPTDMQSLKSKALIDSGQWKSKDKLQIRLITASH